MILVLSAFVLGGLVGYLAGQEVTARRADRYIDRLHDKLRLLCRLVAKEGK
jgi:hypothetical protein